MDPLAPLMELAGVSATIVAARDHADAAMRHRALRRKGGQVAAEIGLRAAVASAALEGADHDLEVVRQGAVTDPVMQGALRVMGALDGLAPRWQTAPRQVLARLHVLAAGGLVGDDALGRPVPDPVVAARLDTLMGLVAGGTRVPPLLLAAIVHGELLNLRPFEGPSGVVARAAARLTLLSTGFDPRGLIAVEVGHLSRQPEYVGSASAFATGTPDGLRSWLRHYTAAIEAGAAEIAPIGDAVLAAA